MKFNPRYELIIGRPARLNNFIIPRSLVNPLKLEQGVNGVDASGFRYSTSPDGTTLRSGDYLDYNTIPPLFYKIKDLQIVANIPENTEQGSKVTFQITNLSDEIVKFIRKDDIVCFRAEYLTALQASEELPDIYIGQVQRVYTSHPDTDKTTVIECGTGQTLKRNSRISYSWPPNTTREKVIRDILGFLSSQGLPVGTFTLPKEGTKAYSILKSPYLSGYSTQGNTMEELGKILEVCKLKGFISKGKYYIQPFISGIHSLGSTPTSLIFKLGAANIKGVPEPTDGGSSSDPSASDNGGDLQSISLVMYFDSRVGLESVIRIDDTVPDYKGDYKITSLSRVYDQRGGRYELHLNLTGVANE